MLIRTLNNAVFLGMSWTWCIGMFLPVLLVRDFGPWAFWIFAIPNVIGAAAMGWVIRSPEHSRSFIDKHRSACRWFSLITIIFHLYFVYWMISPLINYWSNDITLISFYFSGVICLLACHAWVKHSKDISQQMAKFYALAWLVFFISAGLASSIFIWPEYFGITQNLETISPRLSFTNAEMLGLGMVCVLGFLTCPYVDLTFHMASKSSPASAVSKLAFALGFGLFFFGMILLTLAYSPVLLSQNSSKILLFVIGLHMAAQCIITVLFHIVSFINEDDPTKDNSIKIDWRILFLIPFVVGILFGIIKPLSEGLFVLELREVGYRLFMTFYGLVFPAYLLLATWGTPKGAPVGGWAGKIWPWLVLTVAVSGPMYGLAFLMGQTVWLIPGVGCVILIALARRMFLLATKGGGMSGPRDGGGSGGGGSGGNLDLGKPPAVQS